METRLSYIVKIERCSIKDREAILIPQSAVENPPDKPWSRTSDLESVLKTQWWESAPCLPASPPVVQPFLVHWEDIEFVVAT